MNADDGEVSNDNPEAGVLALLSEIQGELESALNSLGGELAKSDSWRLYWNGDSKVKQPPSVTLRDVESVISASESALLRVGR
jgi:hypothetical protein